MKTATDNWTVSNYKGHGTGMEGPRWSATVLRNGKKVAVVNEDGDGGMLRIDWAGSQQERKDNSAALDAHAASLPPYELFADQPLHPHDWESVIHQLVDEAQVLKQMQRWCKKSLVFRLKGDAVDSWRSLRVPYLPVYAEDLRKKHGDKLEEILNEREGMTKGGGR